MLWGLSRVPPSDKRMLQPANAVPKWSKLGPVRCDWRNSGQFRIRSDNHFSKDDISIYKFNMYYWWRGSDGCIHNSSERVRWAFWKTSTLGHVPARPRRKRCILILLSRRESDGRIMLKLDNYHCCIYIHGLKATGVRGSGKKNSAETGP